MSPAASSAAASVRPGRAASLPTSSPSVCTSFDRVWSSLLSTAADPRDLHLSLAAGQQKQVCGYFLKGSCKFGHKCASGRSSLRSASRLAIDPLTWLMSHPVQALLLISGLESR
jgi:hypothetical protein